MVRVCSNGHLTGFRNCASCGSKKSTPVEVGPSSPRESRPRVARVLNAAPRRSRRASAQHRRSL
jgi:hypothetical protein